MMSWLLPAVIKMARPWVPLLLAAGGFVGWQQVRLVQVQGELADCRLASVEHQRKMHDASLAIVDFKSQIAMQNQRIDDYQQAMAANAAALREAQQEAERMARQAEQAVIALAGEQGDSCADGIRLIDRELGL